MIKKWRKKCLKKTRTQNDVFTMRIRTTLNGKFRTTLFSDSQRIKRPKSIEFIFKKIQMLNENIRGFTQRTSFYLRNNQGMNEHDSLTNRTIERTNMIYNKVCGHTHAI